MSGTTSGGWPYVTPDDHPKEYPSASQGLANKLESVLGGLKIYRLNGVKIGDIVAGSTTVEGAIDLTPAGFTATPVVLVTGGTPFNTATWAFSTRGKSATGVTVRGAGAASPGSSSFNVDILAIGI